MITTYAPYVWTCYGATAVVLVLNLWLARRRHNIELQAARRRQQMQATEAS
jgi:heme exporter protein CcmD